MSNYALYNLYDQTGKCVLEKSQQKEVQKFLGVKCRCRYHSDTGKKILGEYSIEEVEGSQEQSRFNVLFTPQTLAEWRKLNTYSKLLKASN